MRIAQIAPLFESVPPQAYGGTERVVSYLTEALVDAGHQVTLYASGDSRTRAALVPVVRQGLRLDPDRPDWIVWHTIMVDRVFEDAQRERFDVLHFHIDFLHYTLARRSAVPCLTTLHGRLDLRDVGPFHAHFEDHPVVSISDSQRAPLAQAHWCATVHHGLPRDLYRLSERPSGYFLFLGRISPEKRPDRAIEIAAASKTPLVIAAKVDPVDRLYFEREIQPLLGRGEVRFIGEVGDRDKQALIGGARALLFPIDWPEPFGLVVIEAMACGTPVIAYRHGSVPELVRDGVTGFIVENQAEAIEAAGRIDRIDRRLCRRHFDENFTAERMAADYVAVYGQLQGSRAASAANGIAFGAGTPARLGGSRHG